MGLTECVARFSQVVGPLRLYLPDQHPLSFGLQAFAFSSLLDFIAEDRGAICLVKTALESKSDERILIFGESGSYYGFSINDCQDRAVAAELIAIYILKYNPNRIGIVSSFAELDFAIVRLSMSKIDDRIPKIPREYWPGAKVSEENVVDFIRRVWGPYLSFGLKLVHFKNRDPKLWAAVYNFRKVYDWPEDLIVLSQRDSLRKRCEELLTEPAKLDAKALIAVGRKLHRDEKRKSSTKAIRPNSFQPIRKTVKRELI